MSRSAYGSNLGGQPHNDVKGSLMDKPASEKVSMPYGTSKAIRSMVKNVYDQNPFLGQAQMMSVVRLAKLYKRFAELEDEIDQDGITVTNELGASVPNPMLKVQLTLQGAIVTQERALAISIRTRSETVDKEDRRTAPKKEGPKKAGVAPKLRLA